MEKYFLVLKKDADSVYELAKKKKELQFEDINNCFVIGQKRDVIVKIENINDRLSCFILSLKEGENSQQEIDEKVDTLMQKVFIVNLSSKFMAIEKGDLSILQNMETPLIKSALNF